MDVLLATLATGLTIMSVFGALRGVLLVAAVGWSRVPLRDNTPGQV